MDYLTWGEWTALEQHFMYGKHEFRRAKGVSWVNTWQSEDQLNREFWGYRQPPCCDDKEIWACRESGMPRYRFNSKQKGYLEGGGGIYTWRDHKDQDKLRWTLEEDKMP